MSIQGTSSEQAWLNEETLLISKVLLVQSGDTGVRNFFPKGGMKALWQTTKRNNFWVCKWSSATRSILATIYNVWPANRHNTYSLLSGQAPPLLADEAVTVHTGPGTTLIQSHRKKFCMTHIGAGSHPVPWLLSISNKINKCINNSYK